MSERWGTPPEMFAKLHAEFDFDLDAAADSETTLLPAFLSAPSATGSWFDALSGLEWPGKRVWLNPPYGKKLEPFVRMAWLQAQLGKLIVALIPMRTRAAWWHESVIGCAVEVRCVRKRPKFIDPSTGLPGPYSMTCDSAIVVWRGAGTGTTTLTGWGW